MRLFLLFTICTGLLACSGASRSSQECGFAELSRPESTPASWLAYSNSAFCFFGPPGIGEQPMHSEDSFSGVFEGQDFRIVFDYGWFSDDSFEGNVALKEDVVIDGRQAQFAFYEKLSTVNPTELVSAVYIPNIRLAEGDSDTALSFNVYYEDLGMKDEMEQLIMSLRLSGAEW
ncbi:MAG: hypothetical protein H8E15_02880 [Planctomycetes bacterium]|nr:hypothetical protein [Planctomycetota bacterium]